MSILKRIPTYWLFQLFGWGMFVLVNMFFVYTLNSKLDLKFFIRVLVYVSLGIVFTHAMRWVIHRWNILRKPVEHQIISFISITFIFSIMMSLSETFILTHLDIVLKSTEHKALTFSQNVLSSFFTTSIYLFIWNCIYNIYHYVQKSRRQQVDTLKLEALVKELELKTIKSHINPHFIFNALNSIRALIDENPMRARGAITELSNILRSSMQSDKLETVSFERELNIVKDYLALEHIRFEDRLRIEYDIDEDTLDQPVPPMMLQTLVENAIKHGISKQLSGGVVKIISDFKYDHHELVVQNTGHLNGSYNADGFGLTSTQNRLHLLFGEKANFTIHEINGDTVEAKIILPVAAVAIN
ncbi:MAG: histidine kinase [Bacteroidota bacterium]